MRKNRRISSIDQFRGYNVAGMFIVNFLSGVIAVHPIFQHNDNYFSYADSIMPGFIFTVGISYRLTLLKRLPRLGPWKTYRSYAYRCMILIFISLIIYAADMDFSKWNDISTEIVKRNLAILLKARLWEIFAIIGACQLLIMPVVAAGPKLRVLCMLLLIILHILLSFLFNWEFALGIPGNRVDSFLGTEGVRTWDGGLFGILSWSAIMISGTLAFDILTAKPLPKSALSIAKWGCLLMITGYALSCISTLYDVNDGAPERYADSPVIPKLNEIDKRPLGSFFAEPPFISPPHHSKRPENYWMMHMRVASAPYVLFGTGFSFFLFSVFVILSDLKGIESGLFASLGKNALAAYILHYFATFIFRPILPRDAPLYQWLLMLLPYFSLLCFVVGRLDKRNIYFRL